MKLTYLLPGLFAVVFTANAQAALVSVNASADMTSGFAQATDLLPIGTTVTSNVDFDIGVGTINTASIDNVSGSFNWIDSSLGAQTFNADSARITTTNSAGWFVLLFNGIGPTIDGITAANFSIQFDIGTNPFVPPGSTTELFDLVLNSSVALLRVGARLGATTQFGVLESNVSGSISEVPLPAALLFFISGLLGLTATRFAVSKKN